MGVPKFNGQFVSNLPIKIEDAKPGTYPTKVSGLMIDFNDLLHFFSQKIYLYGIFSKYATKGQIAFRDRQSEEKLENLFIKALLSRLDMYLQNFEPQDYLVVAVDGPVPLAKIAQQRIRRFSSKPNPDSKFDNARLSPGTDLMEKIHLELKKWFYDRAQESKLPRYSSYSSHHEPGEGEHKMIEIFYRISENIYRKQDPDGLHIICGQDGDLLMLGPLIPYKNVVHYREDRDEEAKTGSPSAVMVMVDAWKKYIYRSLLRDNSEVDYVLAYFLFGNDFLPKNPALQRADDTHQLISSSYIKNGRRLVNLKDGKINRGNFIRFLQYFTKQEKANLDMAAAVYNPSTMTPYPILVNNTKKNKNGRIEVDLEGFKRDWYERAFQTYNEMAFLVCDTDCEKVRYQDIEIFKRDMMENYLQMFQWNIDYYLQRSVSWNFQYRYYFTPFISDLAELPVDGEILRNSDDCWKRESSILRHLIMISHPAKVKSFIPRKFHAIVDTDRIKRVSPSEPIIFTDGVRRNFKDRDFSFMYTVVLPLVYHDYYDQELSKFKGSIPERMEVSLGNPDMYIRDDISDASEDEYIPGSKTRIITSKKYVWVS